MGAFLRKYNTATNIYIPIIKRAVVDYAVSADWTPASGDVKVIIDGGSPANIGTLPTAITVGNTAMWNFTLTGGETTGKKIQVVVADSATKAVEDQCIEIETYGHASAEYQADLSAANLPANVIQLLGTAWLTPGTAGTPDVNAKLIGGTTQTGRDIGGSLIILANTAQAGGASTITLNAGASATDNLYRDNWIVLTGGTGAGQSREISAYVGSTKVATVSKAWVTNPDNTSTFAIVPAAAVENVVNTLADTDGTTTLLSRLTSGRAGNLDNLDVALSVVAAYIDTEVAAIKAKTDQLTFTNANKVDSTAITVSDKTGYALTSGERDSIAAAILAAGNIDGYTVAQTLLLVLDVLAGQRSGAGGTSPVHKNIAGTTARVSRTTDTSGNDTQAPTINVS